MTITPTMPVSGSAETAEEAAEIIPVEALRRLLKGKTSIETVQAGLRFLRADIKFKLAQPRLDVGELTGWASTFVLVLQACQQAPRVKEEVIDELVDFVETACSWLYLTILSAMRQRSPTPDSVGFLSVACFSLSVLFDLDAARLRPVILSNSTFFKILVYLWTTPTDYRDTVLMELTDRANCPFVGLFLKVLESKDARDTFFRYLLSLRPHDDVPENIIWALTRRAEECIEPSYSNVSTTRRNRFFTQLVSILVVLSASSLMRQQIVLSRGLAFLCSVLEKTASKESTEDSCKEQIPALLLLFELASTGNSRTVSNMNDLVSSGFLSALKVITRNVRMLPAGVEDVIKTFGPYIAYPGILTLVVQAYPDPARFAEGYMGSRWKAFKDVAMYNVSNTDVLGTSKFDLCDNLTCKRKVRAAKQDAMKCSGCSSVVYCSVNCQKEDWHRFHREECARARADRLLRVSEQRCYRHQDRLFQLTLFEAHFNDVVDDLPQKHKAFRPGFGTNDILPVISFLELKIEAAIEPTIDCKWTSYQREYLQDYLKPRHEALVEEYRTTKNRSMRLAQAEFVFSRDCYVTLTAKFLKRGDSFEAVTCVYRYATRPKIEPVRRSTVKMQFPQ
ncbi:hypothetical protein D9611_006104 [Ephemerocybe angulata]|uniref:MYND-type domain-containing protein n=1 Tax=Ephemerocybe angulata TaxID=980116 RepID=A0A8H5CGC9_9AGAR|nr:hypothetical protein D9611_006104 [Tulosesus angulatus]